MSISILSSMPGIPSSLHQAVEFVQHVKSCQFLSSLQGFQVYLSLTLGSENLPSSCCLLLWLAQVQIDFHSGKCVLYS